MRGSKSNSTILHIFCEAPENRILNLPTLDHVHDSERHHAKYERWDACQTLNLKSRTSALQVRDKKLAGFTGQFLILLFSIQAWGAERVFPSQEHP